MFIRNIKNSEKLFYGIAIVVFAVLVELFSRTIVERITNIGYAMIAAENGEIWLLQKCLTVLLLLVVIIALGIFRRANGGPFNMAFAICVSSALLLSGIICLGIIHLSEYDVKNRGGWAIGIIAGLIFFDVIICLLFAREGRHNREKLRFQIMQQEIETSEANIKEFRAANERLHKIKHENLRAVTMTKLMLEKGEYDKAMQYLGEFENFNSSIKADYYSGDNLVLEYVISKYSEFCAANGINFKCMLGELGDSIKNMDSVDLHILLENLLENACEAAIRTKNSNKLVDMQINSYEGNASIRITNSASSADYEATIKRKSTKKDKQNHGYGLLNITDIVKKYSGSIEYEFLDIYVECRIELK